MHNDDNSESELRKISLLLLERRALKEAVRVVSQYRMSRGFSSEEEIPFDLESVNTIISDWPQILNGIPDEKREEIRTVAAVHLWRDNSARKWLGRGYTTGILLGIDVVCRMCSFHSKHVGDLKKFQQIGFKTVEIMGCGDSCPECQAISGLEYAIDGCPELPYHECRHQMGCRCLIAPPSKDNPFFSDWEGPAKHS